MKKCKGLMILVFGAAFIFTTFCGVTPSSAWQEVVIPYAYVGDGWDTVIIISNISTKTIHPWIAIRNNNAAVAYQCKVLADLGVGQIYVTTFGAISWCPGQGVLIPGIFQVYVGADELDAEDRPFGVAIAINNSSFGGFSFEQYKSEATTASIVFWACSTCF